MKNSTSRHRKPGRYSMGIKPRILAAARTRRRQAAVTVAATLAVLSLAACAPEVDGRPQASETTKSAAEKAQDRADAADAHKAETEGKNLGPEKLLTKSQKRAKDKAVDYLSFTAFSKKGLIGQLAFDGFSQADARTAVEGMDVDWNAQAEQKAKDYLSFSPMSRSGLRKQLEFDGFTAKQAAAGVKAAY